MSGKKECPVFLRLRQMCEQKGIKPDNTLLNRSFCVFAQVCLGLSDLYDAQGRIIYDELINARRLNQHPSYVTIYLSQKGPNPYNPYEAFMRRLKKTDAIRQGMRIE